LKGGEINEGEEKDEALFFTKEENKTSVNASTKRWRPGNIVLFSSKLSSRGLCLLLGPLYFRKEVGYGYFT